MGSSQENLMWQWLREKEDQGKLVDSVKIGFNAPPPVHKGKKV